MYWDNAGASSTHEGTWTLTNVIFEKFNYSAPKDYCKLDIIISGASGFKDIQYQSPSSGRFGNVDEKGFVHTVRNITRGDVKFQGTIFEKLDGGNNFAAPLVVKSVAVGNNSLNLTGVSFFVMYRFSQNYVFEGNRFINGSSNDILTENGEVVINSAGIGCVGQVVIPGHDCAGAFISCDGAPHPESTRSCGGSSPENNSSPGTKMSVGVIATIIILAALVVAAIVIIVVGVYFVKKKNRMQALERDDESSSSSLHEGRKERM